MQQIMDFFVENDLFARHCGVELIALQSGHAKAKMEVKPFHMNGAGTVQGGAIFTLADFTFAAAVNSRGRLSMAINTSLTFLKPTLGGTLYAEAEELSISHKLGYYQINITDQEQQLVASFQGTAYRKQKPVLTDKIA
ncbi:PaaI family thioesterase [Desulfuromusa kysingii]|nr:PaaI family thioesterase [Desulfuromusa kysingii]